MKREASPMECAPVVHAVVAAWFGPYSMLPGFMLIVFKIRDTYHETILHGDVPGAQVDKQLWDEKW
jgi:hypothetical protein